MGFLDKKEKPVKEPKPKKEKPVKEPKPKKEKPVKEPKPKKEKPVKEPRVPKEKPVKEPKKEKPEKLKRKQKAEQENDGMDILTDIKDPFSFNNFFEAHVVTPCKRIKQGMADRGILAFLMSPFQARGRLIAQMLLLFVGIMFGVVPRASSLVNALQDQAYQSEIYGLKPQSVGSITLTPAASSNYKKMHMIAFTVTGKDLPSDASKYEVHLARGYGASDWEDVTYSWTVYPVTDTQRILLVAIDQSKQASGYGAFDLYVQLEGEEVPEYAKTPFEITLSTAQETTDLYDKTGIHLSALSKAVCGSGEISKEQEKFKEALQKYQVAVEQAEAMPVGITVEPTTEDLETYCLANRVYRELDDDSDTEDILTIEKVTDVPELDYNVVLTSQGIAYDKMYKAQLEASERGYSDEDAIIFKAFDSVEEAKEAVLGSMGSVNNAAVRWYDTLNDNRLVLNQTIGIRTFPLYARCTNTIDEPINFLDISPEDPSDMGNEGLHGTVGTDDPYVKPTPSGGDDPQDTISPSPTDDSGETDDGQGADGEEKPAVTPARTDRKPISSDPADNK